MTATDKLDAIQARADAATPGPWEVWHDDLTDDVHVRHDQEHVSYVAHVGLGPAPRTEQDAEFIAEARTDVPALVAALRGVLTIHQPGTAYGVAVCTVCSQVKDADEWDDSPIHSWVPYPCDTLRAIEGALNA